VFFEVNEADITIDLTTDVALPAAPALRFLEPARPNPFASSTAIAFTLPHDGRASLRVYDAAGRLVRVLFDEKVTDGRHATEWDGRGGDGERVGSGIYFVRLESEGRRDTQKVHLLR
jgi:hypothetical protein